MNELSDKPKPKRTAKPPIDWAKFKRLESSAIESVSNGMDASNHFLFGESRRIRARVYSDTTLVSPLSKTPCVYYEIELFHHAVNGGGVIGGRVSESTFYVLMQNHLIKSDIPFLEWVAPVFKQKYQAANPTQKIRKVLEQLSLLDEIRGIASFVVTETVLKPLRTYRVKVTKLGARAGKTPKTTDNAETHPTRYQFTYEDR